MYRAIILAPQTAIIEAVDVQQAAAAAAEIRDAYESARDADGDPVPAFLHSVIEITAHDSSSTPEERVLEDTARRTQPHFDPTWFDGGPPRRAA